MSDFLLFLLVGALAQLVDGALGMAYGVVSSTVLISFGVAPAAASATVHTAEVFTTAASGAAHALNRNIDWKLFWRLVPFGILGGVAGTYVLTSFPGHVMKPYVAGYLSIIGIYLVVRSFRKIPSRPVPGSVAPPLALAGGFLDSVGGGGWGPVVTTGLLGAGGAPRYVIGTVNTAEFLVTLAVSLSFLFALLSGHWEEAGDFASHGLAILGLIVGGVCAAPFAGYIVRRLKETLLLRLVGGLITTLGLIQIAQWLA
ncbi:sulfite exporter TauE/SafE family protein [Fulvimarina sp. 2208YS6-2-32]|uniref:Probable membrane transporter protein n=1 Tax=Fulvimarina uroteuthidis TaxID=3098149 RepID=A0ABU5HXJ6_9HYPH|nr:sulfite exporter TauE/SafE family protein [Fulvimarina sp. 2208YS6-2-32]MDY8107864.1 sulfite exporter TauE/SafE family protein [Fulvimarina sp. 2208YS6-2-32]